VRGLNFQRGEALHDRTAASRCTIARPPRAAITLPNPCGGNSAPDIEISTQVGPLERGPNHFRQPMQHITLMDFCKRTARGRDAPGSFAQRQGGSRTHNFGRQMPYMRRSQPGVNLGLAPSGPADWARKAYS